MDGIIEKSCIGASGPEQIYHRRLEKQQQRVEERGQKRRTEWIRAEQIRMGRAEQREGAY